MKMLECINNFVDTMIEEKEKFKTIENEISKKDNNIKQALASFKTDEEEIINNLNNQMSSNEDENIKEIFYQVSKSFSDSLNKINDEIDKTIKSTKFMEDFEKQFTVSVFGKVKAGKSYIGNFIMGKPLKKANINSSYDKLKDLHVNVYDRGKMYESNKLSTADEKKECNGEEFYVNNTEATSTIQWVDIGAMCWFDTPGIGSVTLENEALAEEYVKNSDLVIFACNSDAAGTRQEFSEIRKLHEMDKPLLLLLTQSDTTDYDDDGIEILVPKSEKDRKDQENYILDTLGKQGMKDVLKYSSILTVSALLATEALETSDEKMFEDSNIGKLLDKLVEITKNNAADIKRKTPKNRVNATLNNIIKELNKMDKEINDYCNSVEKNKKNLLEKKDWIITQILSATKNDVLKIIAKAKTDVEKNSSQISGEKISEDVNKAIENNIQKICFEEAIINTQKMPTLNIRLEKVGDMKMRQDRIEYKQKETYQAERDPEGLLEKAGSFLFDKKYYTTRTRTTTKYSYFDIGVNDGEIVHNIISQINTDVSNEVDGIVDYLIKGYYEPIESLERRTRNEVKNTINRLEEMKYKC